MNLFGFLLEGKKYFTGKGKKQKTSKNDIFEVSVPWAGIEPARPKTLDFESSASTSSATKASGRQKYEIFFLQLNIPKN